jgi:HSP20 family protein
MPSFPSWTSSFGELDTARRQMERLFDSLSGWAGPGAAGVYPAINVTEDTESLYVRAELPGIKADDLQITVENNTLSIAGERKIAEENDNVRYHRRERQGGTFRRAFQLPTRVDANKVLANYVDGILTIVLPKEEAAKPKQIPIKTS